MILVQYLSFLGVRTVRFETRSTQDLTLWATLRAPVRLTQ